MRKIAMKQIRDVFYVPPSIVVEIGHWISTYACAFFNSAFDKYDDCTVIRCLCRPISYSR